MEIATGKEPATSHQGHAFVSQDFKVQHVKVNKCFMKIIFFMLMKDKLEKLCPYDGKCSGNGVCDFNLGQCECNKGFYGDTCECKLNFLKFNSIFKFQLMIGSVKQ